MQGVSGTTRVLVVGDDLQSIYKFRGAFDAIEALKQTLKAQVILA